MQVLTKNILALDVGGSRIGVAIAHPVARLPRPLTTIAHDGSIWSNLTRLIEDEEVGQIVVGLPRNLSGNATAQTREIEKFVDELKRNTDLPVEFQDEALTSKQAEQELSSRGHTYAKGDIDALAATYILEDFLREHSETAE